MGVDFASSIIDASLDVEVYNRLHLLAGIKTLSAEGYEYTIVRDEFNRISETDIPNQVNYDLSDQVVLFGAKYDFGPNSFLGFTSQFANYVDNSNSAFAENRYDLDQIYVIYQITYIIFICLIPDKTFCFSFPWRCSSCQL